MFTATIRPAVLFASIAIMSLFSGFNASAGIMDRVKFSQAPMVIVWQDGEQTNANTTLQLKADIRNMTAPPMILAGGGLLEPVRLDEAFTTGAPQEKTFHVASNSPFAIRAQSGDFGSTMGALELEIVGIGHNAQMPGPAKSKRYPLSALDTPKTVYESTRRTASKRGSVQSQSVTFRANWDADATGGITLTVFIP